MDERHTVSKRKSANLTILLVALFFIITAFLFGMSTGSSNVFANVLTGTTGTITLSTFAQQYWLLFLFMVLFLGGILFVFYGRRRAQPFGWAAIIAAYVVLLYWFLIFPRVS